MTIDLVFDFACITYLVNGFFRCAQCFLPFQDGIYFEFEGRKYCEHDFHVLYAPCCSKCSMFLKFLNLFSLIIFVNNSENLFVFN